MQSYIVISTPVFFFNSQPLCPFSISKSWFSFPLPSVISSSYPHLVMLTDSEINRLIARIYMGLDDTFPAPAFTRDMFYAWQLVEKISRTNLVTIRTGCPYPDKQIESHEPRRAFVKIGKYTAYADTAPRAICLAALKLAGIEVVK